MSAEEDTKFSNRARNSGTEMLVLPISPPLATWMADERFDRPMRKDS